MRRLLGIVASGVILSIAGAAPAAGAQVDEDVAGWFRDRASAVIKQAQEGAVVLDDGAPAIEFVDVIVGEPRQVHVWTPEYRDGSEGAAVAEEIDQWIAPLTSDENYVGTVSAYRADPGSAVSLAYFDADAELAVQLADSVDASVILDPPLSAYFALSGDQIRPLSENAFVELPEPASVHEFQEQLSTRYANEDLGNVGLPLTDPNSAMVGGGASTPTDGDRSSWGWIGLGVGGLALSVFCVVLLLQRARRAPSSDKSPAL